MSDKSKTKWQQLALGVRLTLTTTVILLALLSAACTPKPSANSVSPNGNVESVDSIVRRLIANCTQDNFRQTVNEIAALGNQAIPPLIVGLETAPREELILYGQTFAALKNPEEVSRALEAALGSKNARLRANSIILLRSVILGEELTFIVRPFLVDPDSEVRSAALSIGVPATDPAFRAAYIQGLKSGDPWVRVYSAMALGWVGDDRGLDVLVKLLEHPDSSIRSEAVSGLGVIGGNRAISHLKRFRTTASEPMKDLVDAALRGAQRQR